MGNNTQLTENNNKNHANLRRNFEQTIILKVESSDTIRSVKCLLQRKSTQPGQKQSNPPDQQELRYQDTPLEDGRTLQDYQIKEFDTLQSNIQSKINANSGNAKAAGPVGCIIS